MKKESLRELSVADLNERLEQTREQLVKMKLNHAASPLENPNLIRATRKNIARTQLVKMNLNHAASPLENPNLIRATRKNIARILTELRRRELEGNK